MSRRQAILKALKCAFPYTIPIFAGFWFLGISYGIYMGVSGFSFLYPMMMAIVIFGGSLEFVVVEMLLSVFAPFQAFLMALMIQARHLFYGISMLDKYRGLDFVMTALFAVIFVDQWLKDQRHLSEWIGLAASIVCLILFGADSFLVPTMICSSSGRASCPAARTNAAGCGP